MVQWWLDNAESTPKPLYFFLSATIFHIDARIKGWGVLFAGQVTSSTKGQWKLRQQQFQVNAKQLLMSQSGLHT